MKEVQVEEILVMREGRRGHPPCVVLGQRPITETLWAHRSCFQGSRGSAVTRHAALIRLRFTRQLELRLMECLHD